MNFKKIEDAYDLAEAFPGTPEIDKAGGVIKGVAILTGNKVSRNKTLYTESALTEAVGRYEGAKMYLDHPKQGESNRSIRDFGGVYRNVRREGNVVKGDLHVIESLRPHLFSIAEMRPKGVGLSIRDRGHGREDNGTFLVEGFKPGATHSIDFVTEVSVNTDLFESENQGGDDMDLSKLTKEDILKNRKDLAEAFQADGKAELATQLEESKKSNAEIKLLADKLVALSEAGIADDKMRSNVKTLIEGPTVTLEVAKGIIKAQKEILEAAANKGKKPGAGEPVVVGIKPAGKQVSEENENENENDAPLKDRLVEAFTSGI